MSKLLILKNFDTDKYTFDPNNDDSRIGGGSFSKVYQATLKEGIASCGLPKEIAVAQRRWKVRTGYEETEKTLI